MTVVKTWPTKETIPVALLEDLLRRRIGWVDSVVSPFALAARNASTGRLKKSALPPGERSTELRLVG